MWRKLLALCPNGRTWKKMMLAGVVFGVGLLAYGWGRHGAAKANPPSPEPTLQDGIAPTGTSEYSKRVVAFIYNNLPITREDLGEYLIARFGSEQRLDFLVNHRIIGIECKARGIVVTEGEIDAEFKKNLESFGNIRAKDFQDKLLSRWGKTVYEWRKDVIRPKLALRRLAQPRVKVTEQDLHDAFDAHYGPKVQCRMILFPEGMAKAKMSEIRAMVSKDEAAFLKEARGQWLKDLGDHAGEIPPIHRHFPDRNVEREAFTLKPGEVSALIEQPNKTWAIFRCDKIIPSDATKIFEKERLQLDSEVFEMKLQQEVPKLFAELRQKAQPRFFFNRMREDLHVSVQRDLQDSTYMPAPAPALAPAPAPPPPPKVTR